jgi:hypothetical protein
MKVFYLSGRTSFLSEACEMFPCMLSVTWNQAICRCPKKHLYPNDNYMSRPPRMCSACTLGAGNSLRRTWRPVNCDYGLSIFILRSYTIGRMWAEWRVRFYVQGTTQAYAPTVGVVTHLGSFFCAHSRWKSWMSLLFAFRCVILYSTIIQQIRNK